MLDREQIDYLSPDKPLEYPEQDRLGYSNFARHLSESICKMAPLDGFVISVYGSWGSGKSTLLNFLVYYLKQMPEDEQPIIMHFNPWWFSGHEDLTISFFGQLQAELSKGKSITDLDKLKETIAEFAGLVSKIPVPDPAIKSMAVTANILLKKSAPELKDKIAKSLREQKKKILVIIDDIDRLAADEIRQLFRVIKSVADFPNVVYLLAFDKRVVIKALEKTQDIPGEEYLEKIVQTPFELPIPDKNSLRRLLFEKLDLILTDTPEELFDKRYWPNVYFQGIDHFITTPRDVIRLTNTLNVTYPAVKGEVNSVDFIAIETLRVFCPIAYHTIGENEEEFTRHNKWNSFIDSKMEVPKKFHNSWIETVQDKDRESVKRLLTAIFPRVGSAWGGSNYGGDWESTWRRQLRVCSHDAFPMYFRLNLPEGSISYTEMKALLALADDPVAFANKLLELANQKRPDGTTRVRQFFEKLEDYTAEDVPEEAIPKILKVFFDIGDELLCPEDRDEMLFGNSIRIIRISRQLLLRFDENERYNILNKSMSEGRAISMIVHEVSVQRQGLDKHKEGEVGSGADEILINSDHLDLLEKIALEKVVEAAKNGTLLNIPDLVYVLYWWNKFDKIEDIRHWVQEVITDDHGLAMFLEKFLSKGYKGYSDGYTEAYYRLDPRVLELFLDLSQIIDRARRIAYDEGITENKRNALKQFIKEYEILEGGEDPNDSWVRSKWKMD